jgi:hypothetical protein
VVAGSLGSAMVLDDERYSEAIGGCLVQGSCGGIYGTRLAASGGSCYAKLDTMFWRIGICKGTSTYLYGDCVQEAGPDSWSL